ncbi:MAG TPA: hypothetical protein VHL57_12005 [Flavobacteriales bacterium]|jgi:hypothetical protein|nr:hypothetical protein [Flavobacteriales bacterium]
MKKTKEQRLMGKIDPHIGPPPATQAQYEVQTYRSGRKMRKGQVGSIPASAKMKPSK